MLSFEYKIQLAIFDCLVEHTYYLDFHTSCFALTITGTRKTLNLTNFNVKVMHNRYIFNIEFMESEDLVQQPDVLLFMANRKYHPYIEAL